MEEWESVEMETPSSKDVGTKSKGVCTTLVLVGKTGNGKSATGNSILGSNSFVSKRWSGSVTQTSQLQSVVRPDGRIVRVIDTPGMFDVYAGPEFIAKEITKCLELASDGIHGILLVMSVNNRFTEEELKTLHHLQSIFGKDILNYIIIVFTHEDDFDEGETLDSFLSGNPPLNEFINTCGNRKVSFDNKTKDKKKKEKQVNELLRIVDKMVSFNSKIPYMYENYQKAKTEVSKDGLQKDMEGRLSQLEKEMKSVPIQLKKMEEELQEERKRKVEYEAEMKKLQEQLEEARRRAHDEVEEAKKEAKRQAEEAKKEAKRQAEEAKRQGEELRKKMEKEFQDKLRGNSCSIL